MSSDRSPLTHALIPGVTCAAGALTATVERPLTPNGEQPEHKRAHCNDGSPDRTVAQ